ncbi:MAG: hypothetical protein ACK4TA_14230 [Saprospiraceae bacterium]
MMKYLFFFMTLFFSSLFASLHSQNIHFEGIIKYIPLTPNDIPGDTLIVYFGKQKIRTNRIGTLAERFGGITDEIIDFARAPNETTVYFGKEKASQIIKSVKSGIDSVVTFSDSSRVILGYHCIKSIIYFAPSTHFGTHQMIDTVWSATELMYLAPATAVSSLWHPDYSTGGIPLLRTRTVYSKMTDGSQKITTNTTIACEVQPLALTDDVFSVR